MSAAQERIELLSTSLLNLERKQVVALKRLARRLGLEFGWHYLLDLTWMLRQLGDVRGQRIMDAGAGTGIMQWYLAEHGAQVISVDRDSRAQLPLRFRLRYRVRGVRAGDLLPAWPVVRKQLARQPGVAGKVYVLARDLTRARFRSGREWVIEIYNQDLKALPDIPSNSVDAVVAVSALEHNPPEALQQVVSELMRVVKPGAFLLATLGASRHQDWFHLPSKGWCYTETTLRCIFDLPDEVPSNYHDFDKLFAELRECAELRDNLASFYARSGDNGMPWGMWDPKYLPVGVCKVKPV